MRKLSHQSILYVYFNFLQNPNRTTTAVLICVIYLVIMMRRSNGRLSPRWLEWCHLVKARRLAVRIGSGDDVILISEMG